MQPFVNPHHYPMVATLINTLSIWMSLIIICKVAYYVSGVYTQPLGFDAFIGCCIILGFATIVAVIITDNTDDN